MYTQRNGRLLLKMVGVAAAAALIVPGAAIAKGPGGNPGGGKPGGGEETTANSLSVPAVFVGDEDPYGLACDGTVTLPEDGGLDPLTGYSVDGYFYVQGIHKWQAECAESLEAVSAAAEWGDNLAGDAKLKVGKPIRVEVGLFADTAPETTELEDMTGFEVVKLEPGQLDRVSPYGTLAVGGAGSWASDPRDPFVNANGVQEVRAWASGTWLKIYPAGDPDSPVVDQLASAEINSTGRVVYGYNLRVSAAGDYVIEYSFPDVGITAVDSGGEIIDRNTVALTINVVPGGGGGGKPTG